MTAYLARPLLAVVMSVIAAGCAPEYQLQLEANVPTRLTHQAVAGLALATFAAWEIEATERGLSTTPVRIFVISLEREGYQDRSGREFLGPTWVVEAQGTFMFPHQFGPPSFGESGSLAFDDATGQLVAWGGP